MYGAKDFKAKISGLASTNRYKITINNQFLNDIPYDILAKEVFFPGQDLQVSNIFINNLSMNIASGMDYDPVTITFICDTNMSVRKGLINWHASIFNKKNRTVSFFKDYTATITIEILNKENYSPVSKVILYDAYPKTISEIILSYDDENRIMEFDAVFEYVKSNQGEQ